MLGNDKSEQIFRYFAFTENSFFSVEIFDASVSWTSCVDTYNFFVSQRPTVIASENVIQIPADTTILTGFRILSFWVTKIELEVRQRPGHTTTIR